MSNNYYSHGSFPSTGSAATSASMRAELDLVTAGFDKLPTLTSNANKFVVVNGTSTGLTTTNTLPTTLATDTTFTIQNSTDTTKTFQFLASAITAGTLRVYTMPDASTTLVGTTATQTLTNKTLTAPVISSIVNTGVLTLPTSTDTLVGRDTTDTLTNKTLVAPALGTPASGVATNLTGTAAGLTAGNVTTNANLTGAVTSVGNAASLGAFTSLQLLTALTDETGTGASVFATSPTLVTPALGTPSALVGTNITGTAAGLTAGNVTTNANLTGPITSVGNATTIVGPIPAVTLSGTISGGGNQINNVIIGTVTPLAGSFTNITGSANAIISVTDNTNAALRITQLGTGNALLVEDTTNPDVSPFVIDAAGRVITGATATYASLGATPNFQINGVGVGDSTFAINSWRNSSASGGLIALNHSKSGVVGTFAPLVSGDSIGSAIFSGDDGTAFIQAASISAAVDGTPGTNDMPGRLVFSTTADGASSTTERMRIDSTGQTTISGNAIISVTDNTNAALRITQLGTGNALLVEDTTNPDSTPFVIDASGNVIVGYTALVATANDAGSAFTPANQIHGLASQAKSSLALYNWIAGATNESNLTFSKSKSGAFGAFTVSASGDSLGAINFAGDDGAAFITAASIVAAVDGTAGLNDMPGRLVFSTTADGAATPTERMRISSTGQTTISGNAIISVTDNTNAALRITQIGTGNALLVEDSANPDSTPVVINASGNLIQGHTSQITSGSSGRNVQSVGTSNNSGFAGIDYTNDATTNALLGLFKSRGGTIDTYTTVNSGDRLGIINWGGADGTAFVNAARIEAYVDGTPGTNDMPGRLTFSTTADGASSPTERLRIDSSGNVGIGATAPAVKLEVSGSNNSTWSAATSTISGVTLTVGVVTGGTIAIGDLVYGPTVQPYTRITAGSGSSWTVSVSQTVTSNTLVGGPSYANTLIRITDTDTAVNTNQPTGGLQFFTADGSSPTAGVGAYVAAMAESNTPDTALVFGTRDNAGSGVDANERMRLDSAGNLGIGTTSPVAKLDVAGNAIISVTDNTNAALRITQLGSGNALLVEDSANPDATPFVVNASGDVIIGTTTALTSNSGIIPKLQQHGLSNDASAFSISDWQTSGFGGPYVNLNKSKSGAMGTRGIVALNDRLGFLNWSGDDGVAFIRAAQIEAYVDGTPGVNDMPGRLVFSTTADGASSVTERMRIDSAGLTTVTGTLKVTTGAAVGGATPGAGGVAFPATAVAVADANTLDDYEEGTWTPVVTFSGGNGDLTTAEAVGVYTKIGRLVQIAFNVEFTETTALTNLTITGLPFTSGGSARTNVGCWVDNMTTIVGSPVAAVASSVTTIQFNQTTTGAAQFITNVNTGASSRVRGSLSYSI